MPDTPVVLFLHGAGVGAWMWEPVVRELGDTVRAITPDLPGHGGRADEDWRSHAATLAELRTLIADEHEVTVVGFSLGAQLALLLAAAEPERVSAAVIVSAETIPAPAPRLTMALMRLAAPLARRAGFARRQARQLGIPDDLIDRYVRDGARVSPTTLLRTVEENIRFTLPEGWAHRAGRVVVLVGERERGLMRRSAQRTHEACRNSTLIVVPGAAHDAPLNRQDAVAAAVRSVLI